MKFMKSPTNPQKKIHLAKADPCFNNQPKDACWKPNNSPQKMLKLCKKMTFFPIGTSNFCLKIPETKLVLNAAVAFGWNFTRRWRSLFSHPLADCGSEKWKRKKIY